MHHERDEIEIDLRELFHVVKKKILIIILAAVLFATGTAAYNFFLAEPVYESTSRLYILTQSTSITSLADIQMGSSLALDYLELINSRPVIEDVIEHLKLKEDYEEMLEKITVTNPPDTRILNISVQDNNARRATEIANELSKVARKRISDIMDTDEPRVVEVAHTTNEPIKPEKAKNIAIAFLLGIIVSMAVIVVTYVFNDKIRSSEDVERYLGINTLASVPLAGKGKKSKPKKQKKRKAGK